MVEKILLVPSTHYIDEYCALLINVLITSYCFDGFKETKFIRNMRANNPQLGARKIITVLIFSVQSFLRKFHHSVQFSELQRLGRVIRHLSQVN